MALYILEGCDGTGKSTLAKNLSNLLENATIVHCTSQTKNDFNFFKEIVDISKTQSIIADRFCYGQFVYQNEKERWMNFTELDALEKYMGQVGATIIHVRATMSTIRTRLDARDEKLINGLTIPQVIARFNALFDRDCPIRAIDWWTDK